MTAPIVTTATREPVTYSTPSPIWFDADNGIRFRHLRRIDGLLWDRVAEVSTAFKEERNA